MKTADLIVGETYAVGSAEQFARGVWADTVIVMSTVKYARTTFWNRTRHPDAIHPADSPPSGGHKTKAGVAVARRSWAHSKGLSWEPDIEQPGRILCTLADAEVRQAEVLAAAKRDAELKADRAEVNAKLAQQIKVEATKLHLKFDYVSEYGHEVTLSKVLLLSILQRLGDSEHPDARS